MHEFHGFHMLSASTDPDFRVPWYICLQPTAFMATPSLISRSNQPKFKPSLIGNGLHPF